MSTRIRHSDVVIMHISAKSAWWLGSGLWLTCAAFRRPVVLKFIGGDFAEIYDGYSVAKRRWANATYMRCALILVQTKAIKKLAVYRAAVAWPALERALPLLAELARRGGREQSMFVWYVLATQREPMRGRFAKELQRQIPGPEGDIMNYVEEIKQQGRLEGRQEGEIKGRQEGRLETIEEFLRAGIGWPVIRSATGIDEQTYRALKRDAANGTEQTAPR